MTEQEMIDLVLFRIAKAIDLLDLGGWRAAEAELAEARRLIAEYEKEKK